MNEIGITEIRQYPAIRLGPDACAPDGLVRDRREHLTSGAVGYRGGMGSMSGLNRSTGRVETEPLTESRRDEP